MSAKDDLAFVEFHREEACTNGMSSCSYSAFVRLLALADRGARFTPEHEARIAELEAQVRERDAALKVAGDALRWLVNVVCGVGKSGDYPSISEDGAAVDAAKSALANPLIGGAK